MPASGPEKGEGDMRRAQRVGRAKVLMGGIIIGLMIMGWVPLPMSADPINCIYGFVTAEDTGQPITDLEILFTNERTSETIAAETNEMGYYYISLDDFQQGWNPGDYILFDPEELENYYVCHAELFLSLNIPNYAYQMDLIDTPIPSQSGYEPVHFGSLAIHNRNRDQSHLNFAYSSGNTVYLDQDSSGVDILATSCWTDDGSGLSPGQSYTVYVTFEMKTRYHKLGGAWTRNDRIDRQYDISYGENNNRNPPNLRVSYSKTELSNVILGDSLDIQFRISCAYDEMSWEKIGQVSNVHFVFGA
ncbi:MAG: hypothetical protein QXH42_10245 [Thermoplasmata archaeon]